MTNLTIALIILVLFISLFISGIVLIVKVMKK